MMSGNYKTAIQNLRQSRWRTTFTILGIIIGITSVVTVVSLGNGLKQQVAGQVNQLGKNVITVRPGKLLTQNGKTSSLNLYAFLTPSTLTGNDVNSLRQLPNVNAVVPIEFITNAASGDNGEFDDLFVAGTTSNFKNVFNQKIKYGDFFSDQDDVSDSVVIGSDVAFRVFGSLNPVGSSIHILGQDFTIRGVFDQSPSGLLSATQADFNSAVLLPTTAIKDLAGDHVNVTQILVQVNKASNIDQTVSQINRILSSNHAGTKNFTVLKQDQLLAVSNQLLDTITKFISAIAAISLIVGGIGIMNIMFVSVSERTREIGIRKAIGATNRQIRQQFVAEGLVLTITAGVIGVITSLIINQLVRLYTSYKPVISVPVMVIAVAGSIIAGVIFSLIPALKAARKDPIAALRGE
jgi:putative ABC transport system permease protein